MDNPIFGPSETNCLFLSGSRLYQTMMIIHYNSEEMIIIVQYVM